MMTDKAVTEMSFEEAMAALEQVVTQLERGAHGTVLYPSGVAAIAGCMLAVLKPGDRLLMADNALSKYWPGSAFRRCCSALGPPK